MNTIIVKSIGLYNPTKVIYEGTKIISVGLGIDALCEMWRREFDLFGEDRITLLFSNKKDYQIIKQKTLSSAKSVEEMFYDNGFICECIECAV